MWAERVEVGIVNTAVGYIVRGTRVLRTSLAAKLLLPLSYMSLSPAVVLITFQPYISTVAC